MSWVWCVCLGLFYVLQLFIVIDFATSYYFVLLESVNGRPFLLMNPE